MFEIQIEYGNIQMSAFFGNTLETKWKHQKMPYYIRSKIILYICLLIKNIYK